MAFTKVVGAGIHTLSNIASHNINSSGIITATKFVGPFDGTNGDFSGNVTIDGNLTVNGTTTTLDTNLTEVDKVEVGANNSTVGVAITQSGSGDILRLYDGASQVVTIDDTGNVGIGSAIPGSLLNLASANPLIRLTDTDSNVHSTIGGEGGNLYLYTNSSGRDFIFRGSAEVARITGDGKLGIGTHTPTSIFHLNSSSTAEVKLTLQNTGGTTAIYGNNDDIIMDADKYRIRNNDGSTEYIRIQSDGKVGIGTDDPQRIIHAFEPSTNNLLFLESGNTNCDIIQADPGGSTRIRSTQGNFYLYTSGDASSSTAANSDLAFRIDGDKDVHIYDDLYIPDKIIHTGDTNTAIRFPADDQISFECAGEEILKIGKSSTELLRISGPIDASTQQEFGIGIAVNDAHTHPAAKITLKEYDASDSRGDLLFYTRETNNDVASIERLRIKSDGTVLIGTTNATSMGTIASHLVVGSTTNNDEVAVTLNVMEGVNGRRVKFFLDDDDGVFGIDSTASTGVAPFVVRMAGGEKFRITSGGQVNIGTGNLTQTDRMLNVYGGRMRIEGISSGNSFEIMNSASAGQSNGILCQAGTNSSDINSTFRNTSGTTLFRIRGDGRVGISTDNPVSTLHVQGNTEVRDARGNQNFFVSESGFKFNQSVSNWSSMDYTSSPVLAWDYKTGPGDLFYIGSGGNTAIANQMALVVSDSHGVKIGKSGYDGSDYDIDSSNEFLRIDINGKIGISRTPTQHPLEIQHASEPTVSLWGGSTKRAALQAQSGGTYLYSYENAPLLFSVNSGQGFTERLRIEADGGVNIGAGSGNQSTLAPLLQLHKASSAATAYLHITNTDSGITNNDGLVIGFNGSNDALFFNKESTPIRFATAGTERVRITSGGYMGVGTNNPQVRLQVHDGSNNLGTTIRLSQGYNSVFSEIASNFGGSMTLNAGQGTTGAVMHFQVNDDEKARIVNSGKFGINDDTSGWAEKLQVTGDYNNQYAIAAKIGQSSGSLMRFATTSGVCGSITGNGTNSAYNTSSDYRLKENDVSITDGISRVKQLRPIKFNWKTDPSTTQDGFFAHEVSPVVPESVTGEKDAPIDEIGAGYQMIDHSKLVPLLTAALQEAISEIETLKTKVTALEGS